MVNNILRNENIQEIFKREKKKAFRISSLSSKKGLNSSESNSLFEILNGIFS